MPLPDCDLIDPKDLKTGVEYAVQPFTGDWSALPLRPCRAILLADDDPEVLAMGIFRHVRSENERWLKVWQPDDDVPTAYRALWLHVLGRWDDLMPGSTNLTESDRPHPMTWRQVAAHAYGEVLRHNDLVERLAKVGIERQEEPYLITPETPSALYRSLTLNYDELHLLLRKAGV